MNLEQLRNAMASDATEENKRLKNDLEEMKRKYNRIKSEKRNIESDFLALEQEHKQLCNRCYVLSRGALCLFCQCRCQHRLSFEEQVEMGNELRKAAENDL